MEGMKLSELPAQAGIAVVRDSCFGNLGLLFDRLPCKLVFVESRRFVTPALACEGVTCVVTEPGLAGYFGEVPGLATAADPRLAFFRIHDYLIARTSFFGG